MNPYRQDKKRELAGNVQALTGLATAGVVGGLDYLYKAKRGIEPKVRIGNKKLPFADAVGLRSALAGLAAFGLTGRVANKFTKYSPREEEQVTKVSSYLNKTDINEFLKVASKRMGNTPYELPVKIASDAYDLYKSIPYEDKIDTVVALYDSATPGFDKVAMEVIAANVLSDLYMEKTALDPTFGLWKKGVGVAKEVGANVGVSAPITAYSVKDVASKSPYEQQ